ncbi:hypothetical protein Gpo141_00004366 [Globisporangium polare]
MRLGALLVGAVVAFVQLASASKTIRYDWCVTQFDDASDGVTRKVFGINDRPGHETAIEAVVGDTIEVWVENKISEPTCIHWHGMRQIHTQEMDGTSGVTQCSIQPGQSALYRFVASVVGTFWWHSHDNTQYAGGLRGPLIVHNKPQLTLPWEREVYEDVTVQLADWYHEQSADLLAQMMADPTGNEPVWDTVLVNGRGRFDCSDVANGLPCTANQPLSRIPFVRGKKYRLRMLNVAAFATFDVSIDNHVFQVIAADGIPVQPSAMINSLRIGTAQRYDILVEAKPIDAGTGNQHQQQHRPQGQFWLRATSKYGAPYTSLPLDQFPKGFNPHGLAIIDYDCYDNKEPVSAEWSSIKTVGEFDFESLSPSNLPATPQQRIVAQFTMTSTPTDPVVRGYIAINDRPATSFEMPMLPTLFEVAKGATIDQLPVSSNAVAIGFGKHVEVVLVNLDAGEHPFHMHSHVAWVVGSGTAVLEAIVAQSPSNLNLHNPMQRDVYTVPSCKTNNVTGACEEAGYVVLRLNADNPGVWMLHCHIEWHLAMGLAMLMVEGQEALQQKGLKAFSKSMLNTCGKIYQSSSS